MSESLNIGKTGNYEARVKVVLVTDMTEADRQREEWNLSNKAQRSLREAAGLNVNEPISSVVIKTRSNAVNGCAEPVMVWRRQYQIPTDSVRVSGHPGVTGLACGEGYSREDGRSHIFPVRGMEYMVIKNPTAGFYCQRQVIFPQKRQNKITQKRQFKFPHLLTEMRETRCCVMRGGI